MLDKLNWILFHTVGGKQDKICLLIAWNQIPKFKQIKSPHLNKQGFQISLMQLKGESGVIGTTSGFGKIIFIYLLLNHGWKGHK